MRTSFSFCGVDVESIGLEYAPETKDTYVYAPAVSNVHEETFEGHDGGYSYGASKEPKTFTLRCYYEEKHVAHGLMAKVLDLFRVGRKGTLIFERRPWCYYYATVTEVNIEDMRNYLNGLITITMKAYYPYARGMNIIKGLTEEEAKKHLFYSLRTDPYHNEIMQNTAILDKEYMVPAMSFTDNPGSIILYNPGTERAKVDLVLSGTAGESGVTIANKTTGQSCKYVAFKDESGEIYTDGINGKTVATADGITSLAFLYHDHGFIELEPAFPILRDIYINYTSGSSVVTATNMLFQEEHEKEWYEGKYIFLGTDSNGDWYKILRCEDKHTLILIKPAVANGAHRTSIVPMNEIQVTGGSLTKLSFIYKPTYS